MKFYLKSHLQKLFGGILVCSLASLLFSCQQTIPMPYASPQYGLDTATHSLQGVVGTNHTPTFFAPTITISGGNVTFTGTSAYCTITITFPATSGPNTYFFSSDPGFSATVNDGTNTYYANSSMGGGFLTITSIVKGRYSGTFNINAQDASFNFLIVSPGSFSNL